jgi:hypothetical protein
LARAPEFKSCVAIDWSGAKGRRHKGIAIAEARADEAPRLIRPGNVWSRGEVLDWLLERAAKEPTLFGFDFSFAPPFAERGAYLPGEAGVPDGAGAFWAYVEEKCDDEDLGAASFLERVHRRHFYFGIADGVKAGFMHFRRCEHAFNETGGGKASTVFDAIGASQVAKASFAGMRLLNALAGKVPVWPFDPFPAQGSLVVEIYSRAAIRAAGLPGNKIRSLDELNAALVQLGSRPAEVDHWLSDHQTDALVTAAGMRAHLANPLAFRPPGLTPDVARTEGWTFGIV